MLPSQLFLVFPLCSAVWCSNILTSRDVPVQRWGPPSSRILNPTIKIFILICITTIEKFKVLAFRMSTRKRSVEEEDAGDDEVIGPLPVVEEQPAKKKQKGHH